MSEVEIRELVVEILTDIQQQSGRPAPEISDATRPLEDLEDFDSLNGEEATAMLSDRLGIEIEDNAFVSPKGKVLCIDEIVKRLVSLITARKGG